MTWAGIEIKTFIEKRANRNHKKQAQKRARKNSVLFSFFIINDMNQQRTKPSSGKTTKPPEINKTGGFVFI